MLIDSPEFSEQAVHEYLPVENTRDMHMMRLFKSTRGITLLELMATVVIIGIVASMAVPRFQVATERIKFRSANRDLVSSLRVARSSAITDKEQFGVHFNQESRIVSLFKDVTSPASYTFDAGDSLIRADTLPPMVNYLGTDLTNDVIFFEPNGSARFTGGGNIVCMATSESTVAIASHNILASTGRIDSYSHYY